MHKILLAICTLFILNNNVNAVADIKNNNYLCQVSNSYGYFGGYSAGPETGDRFELDLKKLTTDQYPMINIESDKREYVYIPAISPFRVIKQFTDQHGQTQVIILRSGNPERSHYTIEMRIVPPGMMSTYPEGALFGSIQFEYDLTEGMLFMECVPR